MTKEIHKTLCNVQNKLHELNAVLVPEYKDTDASTIAVVRTGDVPQKIVSNNIHRAEVWLHNASDVDLFIGVDDEIDSDRYALKIAPNDTLIMNANNYASLFKKQIFGFWDANPIQGTKCMVTEFYRSI